MNQISKISKYSSSSILMHSVTSTLREKCPNTEFLVRIFLYSVQIQENTDQTKLSIWTLFIISYESIVFTYII